MEVCNTSGLSSFTGLLNCGFRVTSDAVMTLVDVVSSSMAPLIIPVLLLLATLKLWHVYTGAKDPNCSLPLPPGDMGLPIVGETLKFLMKGSEFFREKTKSYGGIYKTHILGQRTIRVTGADNVAKILKGEGTLVTSQWPPSTRLILGETALAHSTGENHRLRREMILRAFSPQALRTYIPSIQEIAKSHIKDWCQRGEIHGYQEARSLTFTIASKLLLGFNIKEKQKYQMLILFEDMLATLFSMPVPIPGIGLYRGLKARRHIIKEIEDCIRVRQARGDSERSEDALALILEAAEDGTRRLSRKEVQDSALEMLFAGHLPSSSAACSVLMQLGSHPKAYDKLAVEFHDAGILDSTVMPDLTYEMIDSLPYLDAVVKETLRLAPPVGAGYRKALQTFEVDGCQVPKGWSVIYSIRETQHTSGVFGDAMKFDPDRWMSGLDELVRPNHSDNSEFNFVPFGHGNRSCVGQQFVVLFLKIFIIELVRNATWRLPNGTPEILYMPVPHPKDNMPLQFRDSPPDLRRRAFTLSW